jgi:hypothetical protein
MASYISYAEKQAASQINWAEISKNLSDTLYKEAEIRQEKKDAIDKATREFGQKLNDAPTGEYRNGSEWILNYANSASEMRLIQDRLLKSGQLSLRDYNIGRQNLVDGTNNLFTLMDEYQTEYSKKMKDYQEGKISGATLDIMEATEGMANLTTTEAYINPTSFNVNLATMKKNKDGVFEMDGNFVSIPELRNRIKMDVKKYDINTNARNEASKLGKASVTEIQRIKNARGLISITQITDPRNKDVLSKEDSDLIGQYEEWEKNTVASIIQNDFNLLSIVRDGLAGDYKVTFDKEEFKSNKNTIYMNTESGGAIVPEFHPEQKAAAEELLKEQIRNYIDQDTKVQVVTEQAPQRPVRDSGSGAGKGMSSLENWAMFGTGTAQQKAQAKSALLNDYNSGKKKGELLLDVEVNPSTNTVTFKYDDANRNTTSPLPSETRDWLNLGKFIHGVEGKDAEKAFGRFVGRPVTSDFSQAAGTQLRQLDPARASEKIASSINLGNLIIQDDDNLTAENLNNNPILKEIGINFVSDKGMVNQEIIYTKPVLEAEGESPTIRIPINTPTQIQVANQTIKAIISNYGPYLNEDAMRKYSMDSAPSGGSSPARKAPR